MHPNKPSNLCELMRRHSIKTWYDLMDSQDTGMTLSEESITDYLLMSLAKAAKLEMRIRKFSKIEEGGTTGADWEWWFIGHSKAFGMRVQAKRLNTLNKKYDSLNHKVRGTNKKQINLLLSDANKAIPRLFPIYLFYNYWEHSQKLPPMSVCLQAQPLWQVFGCTVCDAVVIKKQIGKNDNSLDSILPLSMPWTCLACCFSDIAVGAQHIARELELRTIGQKRRIGSRVPNLIEMDQLPKYAADITRESSSVSDQVFQRPEGRALDGIVVFRDNSHHP